jgi:hypothetical protein
MLQEIADEARQRFENRSFRRPFGTDGTTPQQLEEEAELAVFKANLAVLEHKQSCKDCKRGYVE